MNGVLVCISLSLSISPSECNRLIVHFCCVWFGVPHGQMRRAVQRRSSCGKLCLLLHDLSECVSQLDDTVINCQTNMEFAAGDLVPASVNDLSFVM